MTMVQVLEGTAVSTQCQHNVQYKEGHADYDFPIKIAF